MTITGHNCVATDLCHVYCVAADHCIDEVGSPERAAVTGKSEHRRALALITGRGIAIGHKPEILFAGIVFATVTSAALNTDRDHLIDSRVTDRPGYITVAQPDQFLLKTGGHGETPGNVGFCPFNGVSKHIRCVTASCATIPQHHTSFEFSEFKQFATPY